MNTQKLLFGAIAVVVLAGVVFFITQSQGGGESTSMKEAENGAVEKGQTYSNALYGFKVTTQGSKQIYSVECPMDSYKANNAVATIPLTGKKTECVRNQDPIGSYIADSDMLALVSVYDLKKCINPTPAQEGNGGDVNFCNKVAKLPTGVVQKVTGFALEGGMNPTLVLKNDAYVIEFEGADFDGAGLDTFEVTPLK